MTSTQLAAGLVALLLLAGTARAQTIQHAVIKPNAILPPAEYDRPYKGELVTIHAKNMDMARKLCPFLRNPLGCAYPREWGCLIVLLADAHIERIGIDPELVRRHEVGHCNGWPADHRGARENR